MDRLLDKTILITGGLSKLGRACCERLIEQGAQVVILDRDLPLGRAFIEDMTAIGGRLHLLPTDLSAPDQITAALQEARRRCGQIDGVLHNTEGLEDTCSGFWDSHLQGLIQINACLLPLLAEQGNSTILTLSPLPPTTNYLAMTAHEALKGAIHRITLSQAACYGAVGLRFNTLHPAPPYIEGSLEDMTWSTLFLLSPEARGLTGTELTLHPNLGH